MPSITMPRVHAQLGRPFELATAALFGMLSSMRGARIFHPVGDIYVGSLTIDEPPEEIGAALLDEPGTFPAIVRISRGIGLPEPAPDFLGLSLKLPDRHGPGRDQDLLLVSSGATPIERRLLIPTDDVLGRPYSSVLPYEVDGRRLLFGAIPERLSSSRRTSRRSLRGSVPRGDVRFSLAVAGPLGPWRSIGTLRLTALMGPDDEIEVNFDPWNTSSSLRPAGVLNGMREAAYAGSRDGRGAGDVHTPAPARARNTQSLGFGVERIRIDAEP